ncbi:hypothetical protein KL864_31000 [Mycolicibacterium goodii]|uniref:FtsK/SpoIIIE domain-containing protein n=1 Tax=Mycolicibacterium goodii TaxID=134601 RepID=UPI001BDBE2FB|nr:FtsK/SpoIIIE domain-containing protein [Mycolicibacterium goodii]MBU8820310.1 hypothetical protein [Mycolicibacterium goodii]
MAKFDLENLVSATELARNTAALVKQASDGSRFLIINKNTPMAALIGIEDLQRLDALTSPSPASETATLGHPGSSSRKPTSEDFCAALGIDPDTLLVKAIPRVQLAMSEVDSAVSNGDVPIGSLEVPIGMTPTGDLVWLDMTGPEVGGMGPHGLILGNTGSGKSSVARTIALGLCLRYSPNDVNIFVVDRTPRDWVPFLDLPHVTRICDGSDTRLQADLDSEIARRVEILAMSGDSSGQSGQAPGVPRLPHLVLIFDEKYPERLDYFGQLVDLDPRLRIHVLAVAQRMPKRWAGRFNFRIVFRMRSLAESREAIGSSAAAMIQSTGTAILLRDTQTNTDFTTFPLNDLLQRWAADKLDEAERAR